MGRRLLGLGPLFDCCVSPSVLRWLNWVEKKNIYERGGITGAPSIFDELAKVTPSARGEYEVASAIENQIEARGRVEMYEVKGPWCDVGRPEDLACAEDILASTALPADSLHQLRC